MSELALELEETVDVQNNVSNTLAENLKTLQENFLQSSLGKAINSAVDIGLKAILPDLIEDEVINVKDAILENGFKDGLKEIINSGINLGKSALGIVTGNFENTEQVQLAVKKGGILDKVSDLLDYSIKLAQNKNVIDKSMATLIKNGKNSIISSISDKIEETLTTQIKAVEKVEKYCENWNEAYGNKDISSMDKAYKNITTNLNKIVPLENVIKEARKIENLHSLIKNNGNNFDISEDEIKLAEKI